MISKVFPQYGERGGKAMIKTKEITIKIKRINANKYIVDGKQMDYLELVQWFKDKVTDD
ncbi:MAG: hypothetical protein N2489_09900 [Clostridia bacterium]|nr:hypothetical protein [Clostridia bacterium]